MEQTMTKKQSTKETKYFEVSEARELLKACRIDSEIIGLILSSEVSYAQLYHKLTYWKFEELLEIADNLRSYKEHEDITFRTPSEYLEVFSARNPEVKIGSYVERFKEFEDIISDFYNLFRENCNNLEQNLNTAFGKNESENYDRTMKQSDILNSAKQRVFIMFLLQRLATLDQAQAWLKKQFMDKAIKNAKRPEYCDVNEFKAIYSRDFDMRSVLSLGFGIDFK